MASEIKAAVPATQKPSAKSKSAKVPKDKKSAVAKKSRAHPPYSDMINEAIASLKERSGSSQYAIAKFIEDKETDLPPTFKKHILIQLRKLVACGKLTKVKGSFKLSAPVKSPAEPDVAKKDPAAKPKKVVAKPKKAVAATASTPVKAKKKVVAKPKAKSAVVEKKPKKAAKATSLGKRKAVEKVAVAAKKSPVKKAVKKVKSLKSPAKKAKK